MPIGAPLELWRAIPKHPANEWIEEKSRTLDRDCDDKDIAFYSTRTLLDDVVHAAGAIEYTVARIETIADNVQLRARKHGLKARSTDVRSGFR